MKSELGVLWRPGVGAKNIPRLFFTFLSTEESVQKAVDACFLVRLSLVWEGRVLQGLHCKTAMEFAGRQPRTGIPNFSEGSRDVGNTHWYDATLVKSRMDFPQRGSGAQPASWAWDLGKHRRPGIEGSHARFNVLLSLSGNS